ncbi:hypothetical protein RF11_16005 [Thelohanellus kitauei]|uniref:Uncharacterized protein n=1 Tax=Thelohanellus kitauei TaxID=669202 RepID=A0A0C2MHD5_THEKT|nr:hypothetical protein RF11_16005 [Thelohanellus kitauei]
MCMHLRIVFVNKILKSPSEPSFIVKIGDILETTPRDYFSPRADINILHPKIQPRICVQHYDFLLVTPDIYCSLKTPSLNICTTQVIGSDEGTQITIFPIESLFLPEEMYMSVYHVEISPTDTRMLHKNVQYKLGQTSNPKTNDTFHILRLARGTDHHAYVVDTLKVHFREVGINYYITGAYNSFYIGFSVSEKGRPWESIPETKYHRYNWISFAPNSDQSYEDFPKYAEIHISLINSRGRVIYNPRGIKDIVLLEIVNNDEASCQSLPIRTTKYMESGGQSTLFRVINSQKKSFIQVYYLFVRPDDVPLHSIRLFETFTTVYRCEIDDKRKNFLISLESQCQSEAFYRTRGVSRIPRRCSLSDVVICKSQTKEMTDQL